MRVQALVGTAILTALVSASAEADTITTTTQSFICSCGSVPTPALAPFDSSLGTLTGITLQADTTIQWASNILNLTAPDPVFGTIDLSSSGPFNVFVNGGTYTFDVSGTRHISINGTVQTNGDLFVTGGGTFVLDPSLFNSFVDATNNCGGVGVGVCASSAFPGPSVTRVVSPNLFLQVLDTAVTTHYSLAYTYTPLASGVPEPSTWAMMLIGFGAIGFAVRRQPDTNRLLKVA